MPIAEDPLYFKNNEQNFLSKIKPLPLEIEENKFCPI